MGPFISTRGTTVVVRSDRSFFYFYMFQNIVPCEYILSVRDESPQVIHKTIRWRPHIVCSEVRVTACEACQVDVTFFFGSNSVLHGGENRACWSRVAMLLFPDWETETEMGGDYEKLRALNKGWTPDSHCGKRAEGSRQNRQQHLSSLSTWVLHRPP